MAGLGCLFALLSVMLTPVAYAADAGISIMKSQGEVKQESKAAGDSEKEVLGSVLRTGPDGRAVVKVGSSGYVVLEKNSQVEISKSSGGASIFRHVTGLIYYALNKVRGSHPGHKVKTAAATIGVRGTRFMIADVAGRKELGMRKGLVNVESESGEFEIHRRAELDEFEAFKQEGAIAIEKERKAFETYKSDLHKEFVEYKREFSLGADRMASFDGNRVVERELSEDAKREMNDLESFAAEWLNEVDD